MSLRLSPDPSLTGALSILLTMAPLATVHGQDPVEKPVPTARGSDRLPPPRSITVRQAGSTITLTWSAVEGAKSYVLGRAVGNEGFRRLLDASTRPDTIYVDRQVRPGARHIYTVTAVSQADVAGMRATSDPIETTPAFELYTRILSVRATLAAPDRISITWASEGPSPAFYEVTRFLDGKWAGTLGRVTIPTASWSGLPPGAHHVEVRAIMPDGHRTEAMRSNVVQVTGSTPVAEVPTSTAGPVTAASAPDATAAVLVSMAAPATLRVGGTVSLPAAGQWTSLDGRIATVSADGAVTGRAAGTAQLVALGTAGDGAVRVTVVRVVVQP